MSGREELEEVGGGRREGEVIDRRKYEVSVEAEQQLVIWREEEVGGGYFSVV